MSIYLTHSIGSTLAAKQINALALYYSVFLYLFQVILPSQHSGRLMHIKCSAYCAVLFLTSTCLHSGCWTVALTGASRSAIAASVSRAPAHQAWWRRAPALRRRWANSWIWAALSDGAAQIPSPPVERHAANPWPVAPVVRKRGATSDSMHPKYIALFVNSSNISLWVSQLSVLCVH